MRACSDRLCAWLILAPILLAACDDPARPPPVRHLELAAEMASSQGILTSLPEWIAVRVTDEAGVPVEGTKVEWSVAPGGGWAGPNWRGPWTDSAGMAYGSWTLGPQVGEQTVTVAAEGASPLQLTVEADPGKVFVGVWRKQTEERMALLPSDTIRIHATASWFLEPADSLLAEAEGPIWTAGFLSRHIGLDTLYVFGFVPSRVWATRDAFNWTECTRVPPATTEELEETLAAGWYDFCNGYIELVRIEEVPAWHLERLETLPRDSLPL